MKPKIRWGVLGPGNIAHSFVQGLKNLDGAEITVVASRSDRRASAFGKKYNIPMHYGNYRQLAADPRVDVVYIATPHSAHYENARMCLEHGKAVLCEKPFTINAHETEELIALARSGNLFLMEAMWTRFLPVVIQAKKYVDEGLIGPVRMIQADLGFKAPRDPLGRLFNPELGGGALLDVGIYPLSLAWFFLGRPGQICSRAQIGSTGVDEQSAAILMYDSGALANLSMSICAHLPCEAIITGTRGRIRLHGPVYRPTGLTLSIIGQKDEYHAATQVGNGYNYEAAEVMRCLHEGRLESETMPLDESLAIMKAMDEMRRSWNLKYPNDSL